MKQNGVFRCGICGCSHSTRLNTYKHYWESCDGCGNMLSSPKEACLGARFFWSSGFAARLMPARRRRLYLPEPAVQARDEAFYDYYGSLVARQQSSKGTKWSGRLQTLKAQLNKVGAGFDGNVVLDISGGPGFLAKELEGVAAQAVVTEYSEVAVKGMSEYLGVRSVRYDFNRDRLSELIDDIFDVVLVNSLNFCTTVNRRYRLEMLPLFLMYGIPAVVGNKNIVRDPNLKTNVFILKQAG